ncbi:hypothetical protein CEXT_129801 [Caerostris extrusa]|uniref:Uncharacterized protein n=1 Tax=Caerostris extrusa TaxID=172846 RepID=A0AAV4NYT2_CAEEX|nr:hypothetical protein CEXT_129801 [Caerostris extrusa]
MSSIKIFCHKLFHSFADAAKSHAAATQQRIAASTSCLLVVIPVSEDELFARYPALTTCSLNALVPHSLFHYANKESAVLLFGNRDRYSFKSALFAGTKTNILEIFKRQRYLNEIWKNSFYVCC